MTDVADFDLLDASASLPASLEAVHVLVWAGPDVLGIVTVPPLRPSDLDGVRGRMLQLFGRRLLARRVLPEDVSAGTPSAADVTLVICLQEGLHLAALLRRVGEMDPAPAQVVVVGRCADGEQRRVQQAGHRWLEVTPPGLNAAREQGRRAVTTDLVAFLDENALPHRRLAGALAEAFFSPEVGAVTGLAVPAELVTPSQRLFERTGGLGRGFDREVHDVATWQASLRPDRLGTGTVMAFRAAVLERLQGFDERLDTRGHSAHDLDMLFRTVVAGFPAVYEPRAVVRHLHRPDLPGLVGEASARGAAYASMLDTWEREVPELADAVRRERERWRLRRHVRGPVAAVARRDPGRLMLLLAEAAGSRGGRTGRRPGQLQPRPP